MLSLVLVTGGANLACIYGTDTVRNEEDDDYITNVEFTFLPKMNNATQPAWDQKRRKMHLLHDDSALCSPDNKLP